ncbi:bifunctional PIG-L family deacetylase/class I SAM-dependent methyltransferase [Arthrobacter sp. Sa2BUA2]|uniref:Bifunctional PIG-L family deacetylase/class I SAM-dependent methyltransferase n=1 Tax=Arthrobacter pullicola TaxID=2762224 RepID=A0ABR8YDS9_9MICC|nr:bifunctional PIG-L family deacetylase/class I SAM-dependent methyltransferase [Arthrobacter pullicola]MBD8042376.1 bifunctional PIG-L family deacetylase/class I SAM-dependent methyltransferase [Arthrobacter pullicola]
MVKFTHEDPTSSEAAWLPVLEGVPDVRGILPGNPRRLVVLAAHPDDETLGAGGLIASLAAAGTTVDVIVATAGEASHPHSPTHTPQTLSAVREKELRGAVARLAPGAGVTLLGLPDGGLADHRQELARALAEVVADGDNVWLAAPWRGDGHTDHEAAGAVAAEIAGAARIPLLEYPIWLWHWGGAADLPEGLHLLGLDGASEHRKHLAMAAHHSQVAALSEEPGDEALLAPEVLEHFRRPFEAFILTVPRPARRVFEELYAASSDPWNFEGSFYEHRKRALTLAMLPRERFARVFEPGCSIGVLTADLAGRSDSVLAMDISDRALALARERLAGTAGVELAQGSIPANWPEGTFDLVVISEIGYFLTPGQLQETVKRAAVSLTEGGVLLLCHWRHTNDGWPLTGDAVHSAFRSVSGLTVLSEHCEEDFRIDVLTNGPALSVHSLAQREGLL